MDGGGPRERRESGGSVRDDGSNALQRPQRAFLLLIHRFDSPQASLAAVIDVALQHWCTVAAICTATSGISLYIFPS